MSSRHELVMLGIANCHVPIIRDAYDHKLAFKALVRRGDDGRRFGAHSMTSVMERKRTASHVALPKSGALDATYKPAHKGERIVGEHIERLARFVCQTSWDDVPEPVRRHAKLVLLDTLGVILAGSEQPEVQQLRNRLIASGGQG